MRINKLILCLLCALLPLLWGCRSARNVTGRVPSAERTADLRAVEHIISQAPQATCINAKMRFSLTMGGKEFSIGGNLRMKKDDVIQLSLVGFGIFEGGRLEFTRDSVLLLDRIHKQYVHVPYSQLAFLRNSQVDFYTLQALFWNELIRPGVKHVTLEQAADFQVEPGTEGEGILSATSDDGRMLYRFFATLADGLLKRTEITRSAYKLDWTYDKFVKLGTSLFPSSMQIDVQGLKAPATAVLTITRLSTDAEWDTRTPVSKRYTQVSADEIMDKLMKLQGGF